jgi:hypothetical protein
MKKINYQNISFLSASIRVHPWQKTQNYKDN